MAMEDMEGTELSSRIKMVNDLVRSVVSVLIMQAERGNESVALSIFLFVEKHKLKSQWGPYFSKLKLPCVLVLVTPR